MEIKLGEYEVEVAKLNKLGHDKEHQIEALQKNVSDLTEKNSTLRTEVGVVYQQYSSEKKSDAEYWRSKCNTCQ